MFSLLFYKLSIAGWYLIYEIFCFQGIPVKLLSILVTFLIDFKSRYAWETDAGQHIERVIATCNQTDNNILLRYKTTNGIKGRPSFLELAASLPCACLLRASDERRPLSSLRKLGILQKIIFRVFPLHAYSLGCPEIRADRYTSLISRLYTHPDSNWLSGFTNEHIIVSTIDSDTIDATNQIKNIAFQN